MKDPDLEPRTVKFKLVFLTTAFPPTESKKTKALNISNVIFKFSESYESLKARLFY